MRIRYTAAAGGRVAWTAQGAGPPLLLDPGWITDLRAQPSLWAFGDVLDRLARHVTVLRFDKPGCGLSDREGAALTLDEHVAAALAVVDAAGAARVRVLGASQGGHLAAALAARHPDRVEQLVLYGTCADGRDLAPADVRASVVDLVAANRGLGLRALAAALVDDPGPDDLATFIRFQRSAASAATAATLLRTYYGTDVRDDLTRVRARTAVLHREGDRGTPFALGREVASLVPDAVLVPLPGTDHLFYRGDAAGFADAVLDVLDVLHADGEDAGPRLTPREREVADLVADGLTSQAIASRLHVAPRTAETHVENIRRKLDVRSRAQVAAWATEQRLRRSR